MGGKESEGPAVLAWSPLICSDGPTSAFFVPCGIRFGSNSEWYFKHLAGLQQTSGSIGWLSLDFSPAVWSDTRNISICQNLSSTAATLETPRGVAAASWRCGAAVASAFVPPLTAAAVAARFYYNVTVPIGSAATARLPTMGTTPSAVQITESGRLVWSQGGFAPGVPGVASAKVVGTAVSFKIGSGTYRFAVV